MTTVLPYQIVPAPEPRGVRYGLFTAAIGPLVLPTHARAGGITYEPVSCGHAHRFESTCHTDRPAQEKIFDGNEDLITADSVVVYATLTCGAAGHTGDELTAKVLRRLANGEQTQAEAAMADALAAGATPVIPPGITLADTIGELEQWLYGISPDQDYGSVGCIHASPRIASYAQTEDLIVSDGPLLRTRMGTVWAFGGGYPDDGTIYISGQPTVWRSSDVFVALASGTFDRLTNQYNMIAECEYAVAYDCLAASAVFNWGITT